MYEITKIENGYILKIGYTRQLVFIKLEDLFQEILYSEDFNFKLKRKVKIEVIDESK